MKYALMVRNDDLSKKTALKIKESLQNFFIYDEKNPDLVISIGGDGTILEAVHQYLNVDCCFVGIHTGTLGFYTDYQVDEVDQFIKDVTSRQFKTMKRYMLEIKINKKEFLDCIDRATLLVREGEKKPIIIEITDNSMELRIDSAMGSMNENIDIDQEGKDILIGFNPRFLIDALKVIDDETICIYLVNPKAPCFIRDDEENYTYLILPVNINQNQARLGVNENGRN